MGLRRGSALKYWSSFRKLDLTQLKANRTAHHLILVECPWRCSHSLTRSTGWSHKQLSWQKQDSWEREEGCCYPTASQSHGLRAHQAFLWPITTEHSAVPRGGQAGYHHHRWVTLGSILHLLCLGGSCKTAEQVLPLQVSGLLSSYAGIPVWACNYSSKKGVLSPCRFPEKGTPSTNVILPSQMKV